MNRVKPDISVIVPVFNCENSIRSFLESLLNQEGMHSEAVEFVIVDNGSTDRTPDIVREFPVKLYFETGIQTPYAARNRGVVESSGEILAFTDANKLPERTWLASGVEKLMESGADLAGGDIRYQLSESPGAARLYDAMTFNNNRTLIHSEGASVTGNLFVHRSQFEKIGLFPEEFRSGMDVWWTQRAVKNGAVLVFAEKAIVNCLPRTFRGVMKKSYRVGVTHPFNMVERGIPIGRVIIETLKTFAPPGTSFLKGDDRIVSSGVSKAALWFTAWSAKIMMGFGRTTGIFRLPRFLKRVR